MEETRKNEAMPHELLLKGRKNLSVSGVKEVISFDESSVILNTVCGELEIEGDSLRVSALDTARGNVTVDGNISSVVYSDKPQKEGRRGVFGRFFG